MRPLASLRTPWRSISSTSFGMEEHTRTGMLRFAAGMLATTIMPTCVLVVLAFCRVAVRNVPSLPSVLCSVHAVVCLRIV